LNIKNKNFYKNQKKLKSNIFGIREKEKRVIVFKESLNNNIKSPCFQKLYYIYIKVTLRNFHINILDKNKKNLKHISSGKLGYKKAERYNMINLKLISKEILSFFEELDTNNLKSDLCICLILNGFNSKRTRFVKSIINSSVKLKKAIISIIDITGLPHNGCRPKKNS
jgi:ribosomal protein S11